MEELVSYKINYVTINIPVQFHLEFQWRLLGGIIVYDDLKFQMEEKNACE